MLAKKDYKFIKANMPKEKNDKKEGEKILIGQNMSKNVVL